MVKHEGERGEDQTFGGAGSAAGGEGQKRQAVFGEARTLEYRVDVGGGGGRGCGGGGVRSGLHAF